MARKTRTSHARQEKIWFGSGIINFTQRLLKIWFGSSIINFAQLLLSVSRRKNPSKCVPLVIQFFFIQFFFKVSHFSATDNVFPFSVQDVVQGSSLDVRAACYFFFSKLAISQQQVISPPPPQCVVQGDPLDLRAASYSVHLRLRHPDFLLPRNASRGTCVH